MGDARKYFSCSKRRKLNVHCSFIGSGNRQSGCKIGHVSLIVQQLVAELCGKLLACLFVLLVVLDEAAGHAGRAVLELD